MTVNLSRIINFSFTRQFIYGFAYLTLLYALASYLGAFTLDGTDASIRIRNAALGMPLITVFGVIGTRFLMHCCYEALHYVVSNSSAQKYTHALLTVFFLKIKKIKYLSIILGCLITFLYLYFEDLLAEDWSAQILFMNVSAVPFWSATVYFSLSCLFSTKYVIANFLDSESIDLFSLKELKPVSDLVIYNTALCASILAIIPIFWLGRSIPIIDILIVVLLFVGLSFYLFLPVFKVQKIIAAKKRLALLRLNQAINTLMKKNNIGKHDEIFTQSKIIRELASLISTKKEIHDASEWPIDLPQGLKGILLGASIPLSWAAGSLVESMISNMNLF